MRMTMAQIDSAQDKSGNLDKVEAMVGVAAKDGADLVVLPEYTMFARPTVDHHFVAAAEPLDGPFVTGLAHLAKRFAMTLVAGVLESEPRENRISNTLVVLGPDGNLITEYRKLHLYDAFGARESDIIKPGADTRPVTFTVAEVTVGLMTCYDLRFPEMARQLIDAGAQLILLPSSWTPGVRKEDHWEVLSRARAIENTAYFAAVSQAPPISTGGSILLDPMGLVVAQLGEKVSSATSIIDPARIQQVRASNPCLANRRFTVSARHVTEPAPHHLV